MMSAVNFHKFANPDELASNLAQEICKILSQKIDKKGKATLVLSGGNTPKKLFLKLNDCDIEWDKVTISLCDERWVDNKSSDSNENLVKIYLLKNKAEKAKFIGMYQQNKTIEDAKENFEKIIKEKLEPFDVIVLGMGIDGHTASLFPNNQNFKEAFGLENPNSTLIVNQKNIKFQRLSLTRAAILKSKYIFIHFEGKKKLDIYNLALKTKDISQYPINSILNQNLKNVEVYFA
ncbi:MAG: 6-phosphogluconolactonase [Campylobacteraceae bacterium]|nr:6-phosphogluconolactonase [Campylobacteraceae bacterium]